MRLNPIVGYLKLAACSTIAAASLFIVKPATAQGDLKTYKSEAFGYALEYPASWYKNPTRLVDTFDIQNFPPSKAVHGAYIPPRGAEIAIAPWESVEGHEGPPPTLDQWTKADTAHENVVAERIIEIPMSSGKERAIEVTIETDVSPGPISQAVEWYFKVNGRLFSALLIYWQGDSNSNKYLQTMRQIVSTLKMVPLSRRPPSKH